MFRNIQKKTFILFYICLLWSTLCAQPTHFKPHGPGGGGYMYAPSISPHQPDDFFLVCDMAGVYRTTDGGDSFSVYHYNQLVSTIKGKVQFTSHPDTLYTVSRSLTHSDDPLFRGELAGSTDGGLTWHKIDDPTGSGIHVMEADPNSTQRLLLNEYNQLFFSNNGGTSFTNVFHPADEQMWFRGVFWDGDDIYVGTNHGLLVSHDGGQSFAVETFPGLPDGAGIFQLAGARENGVLRLFIITAPASVLYAWEDVINLDYAIDGAYRLDYGPGNSWVNMKNGELENGHIRFLDAAKNNIEIVYAVGTDSNGAAAIFKSVDAGESWQNTLHIADNENISTGWGGDYGPFLIQWAYVGLGLDVADNDPDLVVVTDGFSFKTTDGGNNWQALHVAPDYLNAPGDPTALHKKYASSGLDVTTTHQLFWPDATSMFAASTDIGNQYSDDNGLTWTFARNTFTQWGYIEENNWYTIIRQPATGRLYAALANINDIYLGYRIADDQISGGGKVVFSDDEGQNWQILHDFGYPVVWLAQNEAVPGQMFASVVNAENGGIFRTLDGGISWEKLNLPARTEGHPYNIRILPDNGVVVTFSARALPDGETLTPSSGVFYSADGGTTWSDRTDPAMQFYTKDLIIDPADTTHSTWYATVWGRFTTFEGPNNQGNGGIYKTTDRGLTWERIFAHERAESLSIHPMHTDEMYVTIEMEGLFYCNNLHSAAPTFERLNSFPFPRPKRVFFNPWNLDEVWVTTMGGANWKGISNTVSVSPDKLQDVDLLRNMHIFPTRLKSGGTVHLHWNHAETMDLQWQLADVYGGVKAGGTADFRNGTDCSICLPDGLPAGVYFLSIGDKREGACTFRLFVGGE